MMVALGTPCLPITHPPTHPPHPQRSSNPPIQSNHPLPTPPTPTTSTQPASHSPTQPGGWLLGRRMGGRSGAGFFSGPVGVGLPDPPIQPPGGLTVLKLSLVRVRSSACISHTPPLAHPTLQHTIDGAHEAVVLLLPRAAHGRRPVQRRPRVVGGQSPGQPPSVETKPFGKYIVDNFWW